MVFFIIHTKVMGPCRFDMPRTQYRVTRRPDVATNPVAIFDTREAAKQFIQEQLV